MPQGANEDEQLRAVALQNMQSILAARQRAEDRLAESLALMRATLEASTDGILAVDGAGRITHFNENYAALWGLDRAVMLGELHLDVARRVAHKVRGGDRFLARLEEIYSTSPGETHDVLELADGGVIERFSRVQVLEGRAVGRVWTFRDVTEQRRAQESLAQLYESERAARAHAERMGAVKDEFLAMLSPELRTPVRALLGWTHVLRRQSVGEADLHNALDVIERNARVQTRLIDDLLDMSRITSGKLRLDVRPVDAASCVEAALETLRPAAEAKGVRVEKVLDSAAAPVSGDPQRLQQVMWNLLSNAIKFTPKGGKVQVLLERVNSHIEISVADTGAGIKAEFIDHVFERFRQADASTTRAHGGLGLGLSIVKSLVELHGGTVSAQSRGEGLGATFTVRLPLIVVHHPTGERIHPASSASAAPFVPADLSGISVLIVDDQPDARETLARVLAECGANVMHTASASDALRLIEEHRPHVLVTDIGMPGMDGYELLRRVRALPAARGGALPAVALTAFARSEDRTRALRAGFRAHIAKPVDASELVATLVSVTGRLDR
ncbi:MAG: ATP-binding response regulator [Betaproteobacteria bacterium]